MERLGYALDDRFYGIEGSHLENFRRTMDEVTLRGSQRGDQEAPAVREPADRDRHQGRQGAARRPWSATPPARSRIATPKPESVLDEDREISTFPLKIKAENVRIVPVAELFEK